VDTNPISNQFPEPRARTSCHYILVLFGLLHSNNSQKARWRACVYSWGCNGICVSSVPKNNIGPDQQKQFHFPRTPMPNLSSSCRIFCVYAAAFAPRALWLIILLVLEILAASRSLRFFIACEGWHQRLSLQQQHNRPRVIRSPSAPLRSLARSQRDTHK